MIGDDPLDLKGQIALAPGAGQGAGRAIALARHNAGALFSYRFEKGYELLPS